MEQQRILFFVNPIAGGEDKTAFLQKLPQFAEKHQFVYEVIKTTGENDDQKLVDLIKDYQPNRVVAVGGDGTLMLAAGEVMHTEIVLGVVPYGSANGMAAELQIPNNKEAALEVALQGKTIQIDNLKINGQHNCIHIGDMGFNARLVKRFDEYKQRGLWGYVRQFFHEFRLSQRTKFFIKTDTGRYVTKAHMIAFANARRYGTRALLNPIGKINDGQFELCIIKDISLKVLLIALATFFTGTLYRTKFAKIIQCKKAKIRLKKNHTLTLQADGEVLGDVQEVSIEIQPHALLMAVPTHDQLGFLDQLLKDLTSAQEG